VLEVVALGAGRGARRSGGSRASGILAPGIGMIRSKEKMVDQWPDPADRLLAELR